MNFDLISKHISPDFVIDVGANIGGFYKEAEAAWPEARFFLIEGNIECADMLAYTGADFTIALLSDREKEVEFFTLKDCATATGASYYRENTEFFDGEKGVVNLVKTTTLDAACSDLDLWGQVLLKLDTQGSELDIMRGGEKTLDRAQAVILELSLKEYNLGAPFEYEVDAFMQEKGFERAELLGDIVHPISRELIQEDVLYLRK